MAQTASTLILGRTEVAQLMAVADYLGAVEAGFRAAAEGQTAAPPPMHIDAHDGAFHAKGARFEGERSYVALKFNGNFPANPSRSGLPTIQGAILLCDGRNGSLLAILDSQEVTLRRTAAASVLAAKYLARDRSETIAICGCGAQGRAHLQAFAQAFALRQALVWDLEAHTAERFARDMSAAMGFPVRAAATLPDATAAADIIVTCTTARTPFLGRQHVRGGSFVAAVGADSPSKSELDPALMRHATIVADVLAQCITMGDLHHAIAAGALTQSEVHAELGDLVAGRKPGRTSSEEITVFDSTGTAIEDVASAAWIFERAILRNIGLAVALG